MSEQATANPIYRAISLLARGEDLGGPLAEAVMDQIMTGDATQAQIGGILMALRLKGETVDEITGCARAMRRAAVAVEPQHDDLIDTCGTGGDGAHTFNISTTTAFVVAGAGQPVAKHGNRSVSSKSGSADVLEALGVAITLTPTQVAHCVDEVGLGFLFAPTLHPAMRHAIGPRRELAVRTVFNILGPLTNPAGARTQLMGVFDEALVAPLAGVLQQLGSRAAFVVHGDGGLDELTTSGPNRVAYFGCNGAPAGEIVETRLDPADLGFARCTVDELRGGDAAHNAEITRSILANTLQGPMRDVVILNAGAALCAAGAAPTLRDGIAQAEQSIAGGAARQTLERLVALSQQLTQKEKR
ncbi:MAG: anthranilate phosphoribosyltransferase [Anaerolineales bacterium]|nr:anthranilate phosphoribosyltransferase [Anaerolineales bacterium]MCB9128674.1 anthranilate phosphoribosyltransferase [Ardenticatenales bacterium]